VHESQRARHVRGTVKEHERVPASTRRPQIVAVVRRLQCAELFVRLAPVVCWPEGNMRVHAYPSVSSRTVVPIFDVATHLSMRIA
jgi:hypothetical protein